MRLAGARDAKAFSGPDFRDRLPWLRDVLADAVGATPHMLSQVLNLHLRKSFYVFVNSTGRKR